MEIDPSILAVIKADVKEPSAELVESAKAWMVKIGYHPVHSKTFEQLAKIKAQIHIGCKKGVICAGRTGTGKTFALKRVFDAEVVSVAELSETVSEFGWNAVEEIMTPRFYTDCMLYGNVGIDDLGAETVAKHFGKETRLVEQVVELRYRYFESHGAMTHFTTNLGFNELVKRYGDRTMSRIMAMTQVVKFEGPDIRVAR